MEYHYPHSGWVFQTQLNEVMKFAGKQMELENVVKVTKTQKDKHACSLSFVDPTSKSSDVSIKPRKYNTSWWKELFRWKQNSGVQVL